MSEKNEDRDRTDILAVFAHPDDESWGSAGSLSIYCRRGLKCRLITASAGEAGFEPDVLAKTSETERKNIRKAELTKAAAIIGLSSVEVLDLPDGGLKSYGSDRLAELISERIAKHSPRVVITFDETGITGHRDHITVHTATKRAFLESAPEGSRLVYQILPQKVSVSVKKALIAAGISPETVHFDLPLWSGLPPEEDGSAGAFCVPDSRISVAMDTREAVELKRSAILAHDSQIHEGRFLKTMPGAVLEAFLGWEYYQLGSGPEYPTEPAEDLFEGMEAPDF